MQIGFKDYTPDWREYSVILLTFMSKDQVPLVMIVCEHRSVIGGELIEKEELWKLTGPRWLHTFLLSFGRLFDTICLGTKRRYHKGETNVRSSLNRTR